MKKAILCFPYIESNAIQIPTGLYKIGTYCKTEYDIEILDQRITTNFFDKLEDKIHKGDYLCLGLSVMTGEQIKHSLEISKRFHKKIKIVWGGFHPTIFPKETIKNPHIDFIIRGEGEASFLNLLRFLDTNDQTECLFLDKFNNNLNYNTFSGFTTAEYIDFTKYIIDENYFVKRDGFNRGFTLETSRGCPYNCYFCHNSIFKSKYKAIDQYRVIDLIDNLVTRYKIDGVAFQEDLFFAHKNRAYSIIQHLKKINQVKWKANSRVNIFNNLTKDKGFMDLLSDSGCTLLQFGVESGSNRTLKLINKNFTISDVIHLNKLLSKYPIKIRYNFILGFPFETDKDFESTIELLKILENDNPNMEMPFINIYNPYPGTPLYDLAIEKGFPSANCLETWSEMNWNKVNLPWLDNKTSEKLELLSLEFAKRSSYLK